MRFQHLKVYYLTMQFRQYYESKLLFRDAVMLSDAALFLYFCYSLFRLYVISMPTVRTRQEILKERKLKAD